MDADDFTLPPCPVCGGYMHWGFDGKAFCSDLNCTGKRDYAAITCTETQPPSMAHFDEKRDGRPTIEKGWCEWEE